MQFLYFVHLIFLYISFLSCLKNTFKRLKACHGTAEDLSLSLAGTNTSNKVVTLLFPAVASWPCCTLFTFSGPK